MSTPTCTDEVVKDFERAWKRGEFEEEPNRPRLLHASNFLREKLPTLVEQAKGEVAKEIAMAGENKISLLDNDNFTGTYWISLNSLYFHLTGRHINADWENGVIEKNPSIEAFLREDAARTISSDKK